MVSYLSITIWETGYEPNRIQRKRVPVFLLFPGEERPHIHVVSATGESKFWMEPKIEIAKNYYHSAKQLKEIKQLIQENHHAIISAWNRHFRR